MSMHVVQSILRRAHVALTDTTHEVDGASHVIGGSIACEVAELAEALRAVTEKLEGVFGRVSLALPAPEEDQRTLALLPRGEVVARV